MKTISKTRLPASLDNLGQFTLAVSDAAKECGFSDEKVNDAELVTEEAVVNIIKHAYKFKQGDIEIICKADDSGRLIVEIEDTGVGFDVSSAQAPDIDADIESRPIGGLGIFFMKSLTENLNYTRMDTKNILRFVISVS